MKNPLPSNAPWVPAMGLFPHLLSSAEEAKQGTGTSPAKTLALGSHHHMSSDTLASKLSSINTNCFLCRIFKISKSSRRNGIKTQCKLGEGKRKPFVILPHNYSLVNLRLSWNKMLKKNANFPWTFSRFPHPQHTQVENFFRISETLKPECFRFQDFSDLWVLTLTG